MLREGTDYGDIEYTLEQKVEQVKQQLAAGEAFIEYSEERDDNCALGCFLGDQKASKKLLEQKFGCPILPTSAWD